MKPGKEGQDSLNNIIRQAIDKETLLSVCRTGGKDSILELFKGETAGMSEAKEDSCSSKDSGSTIKGTKTSSEQMQALKIPEAVLAFAQAAARANGEPEKYLPGWPLFSPAKVQLQKCEKCSREFCSMINYRRHILVHRRTLKIDKDFPRNREYLGAFWDKLSSDKAEEILSFTNMSIEEVSGASIIRVLSLWIGKPFFHSLPQTYAKAGSALLDVIQARPASSPICSKKLFSILDDASENTFLCTGTAVSLQKFVFDGEVSKIALEMKNLIACISFLLEQKLVKSWVADKDAEALRCHKLLMEEEEAAQRRQAELLERKRLKKLRQKEQKTKDLIGVENRIGSIRSTEGKTEFPGRSSSRTSSHSDLNTPAISENQVHHFTPSLDPVMATDFRMHVDTEVAVQYIVQNQMNDKQHPISTQHLLSKPKKTIKNGFGTFQVPAAKFSGPKKNGLYKDTKAASSTTGYKIWTQKNRREEVPYDRMDKIHPDHSVYVDGSKVIIGSICVALGSSDRSKSSHGKLVKPCTKHNNVKSSTGMLWKPVGCHESGYELTTISDMKDYNLDVSLAKNSDQVSPSETHLALVEKRDSVPGAQQDSLAAQTSAGPLLFSSKIAEAFLTERWKEAIAADHVKLVLPSETEAYDSCDNPQYDCSEERPHSYDCLGHGKFGSGEKGGVPGVDLIESSSKPKFRTKPDKNYKLKYVAKQRSTALGE
ncbi:unnamed protein product [Musa acuminata subsp. burmannicoides]